ncbi:putative pyrroloquinoline-quinone binding quinoprotein [Aliiruegeria haliotis]|uniref:Putative pyrroloquinoline-quinone binding quinoprotein n=1 Tax=Aliiruegeria haliotis TaxID=1280846 RepID=A0A2T0RFW1_9RHOB|nr:PQQ-binding-like beta-propeller repeat protein [Aliiruegeria haliotis]PRY20094.1 putative pyrroloquinoline-quinone binding quinoprotein [Aliiruegeria haliotis]
MSFLSTSAVAITFFLFLGSQVSGLEELPFDHLVVEARIEKPSNLLSYGHGALWAVSRFEIVRIDPINLREVRPIVGTMTSYPAFGIGEGAAWVAQVKDGTLYKLDGRSGDLLLSVRVNASYAQSGLAFGDNAVWLLTLGDNQALARVLSAFDVETGNVRSRLDLPAQGFGVSYANGNVWVTSQSGNELYRVDPAANAILSTIPLRDRPGPVAVGGDSVWVLNLGDGTVQRVDATTGVVTATIETPLPRADSHIAFGGGYLWITPDKKSPLIQIDPNTNEVLRSYHGAFPTGLDFGDGAIWVSERNHILRLVPPE